jgi:hypothetical protein
LDFYKRSGALGELMIILEASNNIRFEFEICGMVQCDGELKGTDNVILKGTDTGVILKGKPDAHFVTREGIGIILDWKVNGYMGIGRPVAGYMERRDGWGTRRGPHRDVCPVKLGGVWYNADQVLDEGWARQLAVYAWLLGEQVGGEFIVAVEQLVCRKGSGGVEVCSHRCRIGVDWQKEYFNRVKQIWEIVRSDWVFRDMSREESLARCKILDEVDTNFDFNQFVVGN